MLTTFAYATRGGHGTWLRTLEFSMDPWRGGCQVGDFFSGFPKQVYLFFWLLTPLEIKEQIRKAGGLRA